jgi:hypothetical protein
MDSSVTTGAKRVSMDAQPYDGCAIDDFAGSSAKGIVDKAGRFRARTEWGLLIR